MDPFGERLWRNGTMRATRCRDVPVGLSESNDTTIATPADKQEIGPLGWALYLALMRSYPSGLPALLYSLYRVLYQSTSWEGASWRHLQISINGPKVSEPTASGG